MMYILQYLTSLANTYDANMELLKTTRKTNLNMPNYIVSELISMLNKRSINIYKNLKITIYGYTYKEDISDIRNSRVLELYELLVQKGFNASICDYLVDKKVGNCEINKNDIIDNDIIFLTTPHLLYKNWAENVQ